MDDSYIPEGEQVALNSATQVPFRSSSAASRQSSHSKISTLTASDDRFWWDIYRYRLRYLFGHRSCGRFCTSLKRRLPTGVVYTILLLLGLEQLAFTSASEMIITPFMAAVGLDENQSLGPARLLVRSVGLNLVANLLFPIMGWLADVWVGRYRMIHLSLWLLWGGYALAAFLFSLGSIASGNWNEYLLLPCYIVVNVGSAGFQANMIPFGADQIQYKTSHELSSYFYMYYWTRNFGSIMLCLLITCDNFDGWTQSLVYCAIAVLAITVNLCLNAALKKNFTIRYEKTNPLKTVCKVLYACLTVKRPTHRSAFSYNPAASQPSRMDLTKVLHGGKYKEETVEDVKTFLRLLVILLSLGVVLLAYVGMTGVASIQVQYIQRDIYTNLSGPGSTCRFSSSFVWSLNLAVILILIPTINLVLFPFLQEYTPTMLKKIGTGAFLIALTPLAFIVIAAVGNSRLEHGGFHLVGGGNAKYCMFNYHDTSLPVSLWAVFVPFVLVATAEVLVNVSSIEFFYAQSPHTMRGMMVGLFFFAWGVTSTLTELTISLFRELTPGTLLSCDIWYYLILLVVGVIGFVLYVVVARRYKNRQRGEIKPERFYRQLE